MPPMNPLFSVCLGLLALTNLVSAIDVAELRKIAAEDHDRTNLLPELKIYPEAREYKVTESLAKPGGPMHAGPEVTVTEKTVRGRFIVSQSALPGAEAPMLMVATFDKELGVFKKWLLLPDGTLQSFTGVANLDARSIAWTSDTATGPVGSQMLALETHSDGKSIWKHAMLQDGKVMMNGEGVAVKTK
jgi:hypothetical protein